MATTYIWMICNHHPSITFLGLLYWSTFSVSSNMDIEIIPGGLILPNKFSDNSPRSVPPNLSLMDQPPRKRGRPRVVLTKDVVERRRLKKKKSNDSRRNLSGEVHHDGCSGVSPNAYDGPGFDVVQNGEGDVPDHTTGNLNPVQNEVHHDVNESAGRNNGGGLILPNRFSDNSPRSVPPNLSLMDQPPRKRGRPRVVLTKDVVERRRLAKKKSNDSRRNLSGEVHHDGCSGVSLNANDGPGFDVVQNREGDVPNHTTGNLNPVQNEVHHDVNESAGRSNGESQRMRKYIDQQKNFFWESNTILDVGRQEETCGFCAAQVWAVEFTGRHVGTGPKGYSICCSKGKVQLPLLRETPPELKELITSTGIHSNMFFNKSRVYNNIFAFCSFGGNVDHSINNGKGPFVFRVSGRTYHSLGSLIPPDGLTPKFAQLYMYDGQDAVGHRLNFSATMGEVDPAIVSMLQEMLHRDNALVGIFKQLRDRFTDGDPEHIRLRLLERRTTDGRFENLPTNNDYEFAGLAAAVQSSGSHDASVRPDLVARVFKMKLDAMMDDFTKKHVLGRVRAVVYTIEFQKRGLPHAHIVLWLGTGDKLLTPTDIDDVISAEIPDKLTDPVGYNAVSQFMMHGPCGAANPKCPCMSNGICTKHYPKAFRDNTAVDSDGYALYRRRDTKATVESNKIHLDNRHVVPYNRGLLNCRVFTLLENMRIEQNIPPVTIGDRKVPFRDWVLALGDGVEPAVPFGDDIEPTWIKIPEEVRVDYSGDAVEAVVNEIYGDLQNRHGDIEYLRSRAILTPLNEHVENVNRSVLHNLPGEFKAYKSCDSICKGSSTGEADEILYPPEYLNSLKFSGMPNHEVQVKVGAPIMLLRNLNPKKGLCNGTRLIVTRCYPFLIEALILTGNTIGDTTYIPRITMCPADKTFPFVLKRKQFPVVVCYAMTVNKSQGQTVKNVGLYLPEPVFGHGQLYVAVSRVTSPNGLKVVSVHEDESTTGYTKNIVYREIFDNLV
ncbi:hypothetical protein POM88_021416 [Heracleum sosnowskyi]|uniref:ATP-dependent DNA helicase n=1 Tax=Heracleum sosnowskyi TaxID=360622 RepID=A0AAD8IET8_9APIA|nr:hypothetical protein POM88_021416 [Heracleum sosnowskyi]